MKKRIKIVANIGLSLFERALFKLLAYKDSVEPEDYAETFDKLCLNSPLSSRAGAVFARYSNHFIQASNARSGLYEFGMNGEIAGYWYALKPSAWYRRRRQSDAEHTFGMLVLAQTIQDLYRLWTDEEFALIERMVMNHDAGETKNGDLIDDGVGRGDGKSADQAELERFQDVMHNMYLLGDEEGPDILAYTCLMEAAFKDFQKCNNAISIFCAMLDKLELYYYSLCCEAVGRPGSLKFKNKLRRLSGNKISSLDLESRRITRSDKAADIFLRNALSKFQQFRTHEHYPLFIQLAKSAAIIVRQDPNALAWIDKPAFQPITA